MGIGRVRSPWCKLDVMYNRFVLGLVGRMGVGDARPRFLMYADHMIREGDLCYAGAATRVASVFAPGLLSRDDGYVDVDGLDVQ